MGLFSVVKKSKDLPDLDKKDKDLESESLVRLEEKLSDIKKQLHVERYIMIIIVLIFIDCMAFKGSTNWTYPITILILEIIMLLIIGRAYGIEDVMTIIDKIFYNFGNNKTKKTD